MRHFLARLWELNSPSEDRRWVYVPYDQLNDGAFSLIGGDPSELGIVMVESLGKGKRRPYHKQKLALVLANQRQFALEQARQVAVRYILAANYDEALGQVVKDVGVIHCMEPAEQPAPGAWRPSSSEASPVMHPNRLWLTTAHDFEAACGSGQWRMDRFYRHVRKKFGVLIDSTGKPTGGR